MMRMVEWSNVDSNDNYEKDDRIINAMKINHFDWFVTQFEIVREISDNRELRSVFSSIINHKFSKQRGHFCKLNRIVKNSIRTNRKFVESRCFECKKKKLSELNSFSGKEEIREMINLVFFLCRCNYPKRTFGRDLRSSSLKFYYSNWFFCLLQNESRSLQDRSRSQFALPSQLTNWERNEVNFVFSFFRWKNKVIRIRKLFSLLLNRFFQYWSILDRRIDWIFCLSLFDIVRIIIVCWF